MTSISEWLQHLRYGEQNRDKNRRRQGIFFARAGEAVTYPDYPIPTDPAVVWGVDLAGVYNGVPDYVKLKARGCRIVIIKAADGTYKGKLFDENVKAARDAGIEVVGGYCWLYRTARVSASAQANAWWNIVKDYGLDLVVCDFEWTSWNGQADNPTHTDLDAVTSAFEKLSGFPMWVYSAPGYLQQYPVTLYNRPLWIANYNVAAPNTNLPYKLWQCSETWPGAELGFNPLDSKYEDGDIFNGTVEDFNRLFKGYIDTTTIEPLGNGVEHITHEGYHAIRYDPAQVELVLDDNPNDQLPLVRVADWKPDCIVAINGGGYMEYDTYGVPWGFCAYHGHIYARGPQEDSPDQEDSIDFSVDGLPHWTDPTPLWDSINYPNKLITKGVKRTDLDDAIYDPRTLVGWDGVKVYWFTTWPMTKQEAADLAASFGLIECSNMDGGQSTSMRVNGVMVNGENARAVATHLGIKPKGVTGMQAKEKLGKTVTIRNSPHAVLGNGTGDVVQPFGIVDYVAIVPDQDYPGDINRQWLKLSDARFVNYIYPPNGTRFDLWTPPPVDDQTFTVVFIDDKTGEKFGGKLTRQA